MERQNVRSAYEIKQALLKRAIEENRGPELIARILKRVSRVRSLADEDRDILDDCRMFDGQPRSVMMLNALSRHRGESHRFFEVPENITIH